MRQKLGVDGHHVFEVAMSRTVFDHPDFAVALDDLCFDLADFLVDKTLTSFLPLMIASRASMTQFGQRESVVRGQPSVGLLFCQDFKRGLSDHFGVKEGLGLYLFTD
jgi:hypothetical protein